MAILVNHVRFGVHGLENELSVSRLLVSSVRRLRSCISDADHRTIPDCDPLAAVVPNDLGTVLDKPVEIVISPGSP